MAAIDLNTVRSTIEGRVATELANSPAISVVFANMPFEPTIGSSFVQCLVNFAANEYLTQTVTSSTVNSITGVVTLNILSKSTIHHSMLVPLIIMTAAFALFSLLIFLMKYNTELIKIKNKGLDRL